MLGRETHSCSQCSGGYSVPGRAKISFFSLLLWTWAGVRETSAFPEQRFSLMFHAEWHGAFCGTWLTRSCVWQRRKLRLPWRRKGHEMRLQHILFQWSEKCFLPVYAKSRERRNWIILCCQLSYVRLATVYCWLLLETDSSYLRIKRGFTCWCKLWFSSQSNYLVIHIICSSRTVFHTKKELADVTQHCLFIFFHVELKAWTPLSVSALLGQVLYSQHSCPSWFESRKSHFEMCWPTRYPKQSKLGYILWGGYRLPSGSYFVYCVRGGPVAVADGEVHVPSSWCASSPPDDPTWSVSFLQMLLWEGSSFCLYNPQAILLFACAVCNSSARKLLRFCTVASLPAALGHRSCVLPVPFHVLELPWSGLLWGPTSVILPTAH